MAVTQTLELEYYLLIRSHIGERSVAMAVKQTPAMEVMSKCAACQTMHTQIYIFTINWLEYLPTLHLHLR